MNFISKINESTFLQKFEKIFSTASKEKFMVKLANQTLSLIKAMKKKHFCVHESSKLDK